MTSCSTLDIYWWKRKKYKKERETRTKTLSSLTESKIGKTKLELDKVWIEKIDKQFWKHMGKNKHSRLIKISTIQIQIKLKNN